MAVFQPIGIKMACQKMLVYLAVVLAVVCSTTALQFVNISLPGLGICQGSVESSVGFNVDIFKGIPFAKPPVGQLRFQAPKNTTWTGFLNATKFGNICPQKDQLSNRFVGKEDCLTLNVYTPSNRSSSGKLTVMVWIHGGAYVTGQSSIYDARILSPMHKVVVVTINYRLGVLGFFNIPKTETRGNYGLLDQIAALRWVKKNIAAFGGDANKVTIFGESAGATSVSLLTMSPLIKDEGLFIRAISESGVASCPWAAHDVKDDKQARLFGTNLGCSLKQTLVECLRGKTQNELMQIQQQIRLFIPYLIAPVVDNHFLKVLPSKLEAEGKLEASVSDLLIGYNSNEGTMFAGDPTKSSKTTLEQTVKGSLLLLNVSDPKIFQSAATFEYTKYTPNNSAMQWFESTSEYMADLYFVNNVNKIADSLAEKGKKVYSYKFTHLPKHLFLPYYKVGHGLELVYLFGAPLEGRPFLWLKNITEDDKTVSRNVMEMWTNFAKNGNPGKNWPLYTVAEKQYLDIGLNLTVKRKYMTKRKAFWNELVPAMNNKTNPKPCNNNPTASANKHEITKCSLFIISVFVYLLALH